jgi:hypothetical protein
MIYKSGDTKNLLYHSQAEITVGLQEKSYKGYTTIETTRGVIVLDLYESIQNALTTQTGYTTGTDYSVINCLLTITSSDGKTSGNLYALMLSTDFDTDESVSWSKPTQVRGATTQNWINGGTIEHLAENISITGEWKNDDITFDITPYVNIWRNSGKQTLSVLIVSKENTIESWKFHSQQSQTVFIGKNEQTNVRFLGGGDTNTINTEGILVKVSPYSPYLTVEPMDSDENALNRWNAFNSSVSVGNTFSMFLPDVKSSADIYTILDKRTGTYGTQFVISGSTTGISTEIQSTAEFSCTGTVPPDSGIVEFGSANTLLKTELSALSENDSIIFDYKPMVSPNNAKSFTVGFYSDETSKNNRVRLYLKQKTVSENRNGVNTGIKRKSIKPRLYLNLSV